MTLKPYRSKRPGRRPYASSRHQRGFTLVEIILVLVVIAVMVGMVTLALGGNPARDVDREARRLQAILTQASDEAVMLGQELALALAPGEEAGSQAYQLLVLDKENLKWIQPNSDSAQPAPDSSQPRFRQSGLWATHNIAPAISWQLELEGEQLSEQEIEQLSRVLALDTPNSMQPAILLFSSGETTPFRLALGHRDTDYRVVLESDGISGVFLK